ncbi:MAG: hypothetical protein QXV83_02780 [Candidatus Anstonellaceae archaeon]
MILQKSSLNNLIISLVLSGSIIIPNNKLTHNEFLEYRNKVLAEYNIKKVDNKYHPLLVELQKEIDFFFQKFPQLAKGWIEQKKFTYPYFEVFLLSERQFKNQEGLLFSNTEEKSIKADEVSETLYINSSRKLDKFELFATLTYLLSYYSNNKFINQNYFFAYLVPIHLGYKPKQKIEHVLQDEDKLIFAFYFLANEKLFKAAYSLNCEELRDEIDKKLGNNAYFEIIKSREPFLKLVEYLQKVNLLSQFQKALQDFLNDSNISIR